MAGRRYPREFLVAEIKRVGRIVGEMPSMRVMRDGHEIMTFSHDGSWYFTVVVRDVAVQVAFCRDTGSGGAGRGTETRPRQGAGSSHLPSPGSSGIPCTRRSLSNSTWETTSPITTSPITDGPTDAAGAIADGETCARALALGLDPRATLDGNDAYPFFEKVGDLILTGPTNTNVMDVRLVLAG